MSTTPKLVNAWIFLNEDEPTINGNPVGYTDPQSSYQRLINQNIYQSVDILFLCFAVTVPTSDATIPAGNGSFYTLQMGESSHPDGLTNQDYMNKIIADGRRNNPNLKIALTLLWGNDDTITNIFANTNYTAQQNADNFAANLVAYLKHYDLDGFDIDWEFPISTATSQEQFQLLFTSIGKQFKAQTDKKYYLTLSPASVDNLDPTTLNNYFDFVALQLYSGFTNPSDFIQAGVNQNLLAYGAKFESNYQTADNAFQEAQKLGYSTYTTWRLNSGNFEYEQDQQVALYQLVFPA